ncbi:MAG TPA: folate-binding protein [Terriglobales bacterium]|jgi:folate-binding protein YgfZ|nr:folate-binding protein [Terriglobales bacterium]
MPSAVQSVPLAGSNVGFGDHVAEFRALIGASGIYDLRGRCKIALTGGDRVRWLNGMVTNNVRDLAVGHGVYAFLLNPQGQIQADLYAFQRGEDILVDFDSALREKVLGLFDHYIIADDVEVAEMNASVSAIGLSGPKSVETLKNAGFVWPDLEPLQLGDVSWNGLGVTILRSGEEAAPSWQVWMGSEHYSKVWDALIAAGGKPCQSDALELFRIAKGIPRYGQDIRERDLPQETRQERALHFTKGCYIGQEIVERIRSRGAVHRLFSGFRVSGSLPAVGSKIESQAKEVGEVTTAAILPFESGNQLVALGYIRREAMSAKELRAGESILTVANIPFPT